MIQPFSVLLRERTDQHGCAQKPQLKSKLNGSPVAEILNEQPTTAQSLQIEMSAPFSTIPPCLFCPLFVPALRHPRYPAVGLKMINPFVAKALVRLVKIASKSSLSEKFCFPEVFISKTLLQCGVHEKWELKQEVIRRPTDMQEPLSQGHRLTS